MIPAVSCTSHACKRGFHDLCARVHFITRKTGRRTPDPLKLPRKIELVPEEELTVALVCNCKECHASDADPI